MDELLPKMGRKPVFDRNQELLLHSYLLHSWIIGVPRTQELFALDIQYTVKKTQKKTPFADGKPGKISRYFTYK